MPDPSPPGRADAGLLAAFHRQEIQLRFAKAELAVIAARREPIRRPLYSFLRLRAFSGGYRQCLAKGLALFHGLTSRRTATGPDGRVAPDWNSGRLPPAPYTPLTWQTKITGSSDDRFLKLIVLSPVGRSGSTLLQRICNARKQTLIWGEHGGALWYFSEIYGVITEMASLGSADREKYFAGNEDPNQWIASMCPDLGYAQQAVVESARTLLNTLYGQYEPGHDILGFTEIRYGRADVELLRKCYPEADILLLVRHPCDTWSSSGNWPYSLEEWIAMWQANTEAYADLAQSDRHCHLIHYRDVVGKESRVMALLKDLARVTEEQIADVLAHKIGSCHLDCSHSDREIIRDRCGPTLRKLGYE
jgi:hypothetical protein